MMKARKIRSARHVVCTGVRRNVCRILVEEPEGKTTRRT
jgi:hypothetical protein